MWKVLRRFLQAFAQVIGGIVLLLILGVVAFKADWNWLLSSEYRSMEDRFKPQRQQFLTRLKDDIQNGTRTVLLRDLTSFDWDTVCAGVGYDNPAIEIQKALGITVENLKYYVNRENEVGLWFFKNDAVAAILKYDDADLDISYYSQIRCGTYSHAKFFAVPAFNTALPTFSPHLNEDLNSIPSCEASKHSNNPCKYLFIGGPL